ncbi:MAG: VUT family protein [Candidatus Rickettsia vulgarisii]
MALITNVISELYSKKTAMISLLFSSIVSFGLLWNFDYYIHGNIVSGVVFTSLVAVLLSLYCSTSVFLHLKSKYSFNNRNFVSLATCAIVDAIVMSEFFINKFPLDKVISIFSKKVLFKVLYSSAIYGIIFFGTYFIKKAYISKKI